MNSLEDCSDSLAAIEVYRKAFLKMESDITPRLIAWGCLAISRERPQFNLEKFLSNLEGYKRWRKVRENLSSLALMKLHEVIKAEYEIATSQRKEKSKVA